ncbi:MAG TPA: GlsB/YeaQ/YmgE family stress response membrane protein [Chloroflexia bacterium]|nr:GlsB/YeaQ/YmgE family stress response membrane protein [Chloroflexia bacterium]
MQCIGLIVFLVVAAVIGWFADLIVPGKMPYGWIGGIVAAILGGFLGGVLFGGFGPWVGGPGFVYYIIPGLIGTIIVAFIARLLMGNMGRRSL